MTKPTPTTGDLTCPRNDVPTKLTCAQCGTPICPACFVRSPVGLKCQTCVPDAPQRRVGSHSLVVVAALAAVAAIALVFLGPRLIGGDDGRAADDAETGVDASAPDAGLNQDLNVGPMVVTVTRVDCPGNQLGTPPVTRTSSGKYCAAYLSLRNTGVQPEYFGASIQQLSDGARRYGPDLPPPGTPPTLVTLDSDTRELIGVRLNPEQRGSYAMVFDVPVDFTPKQLLVRFTPRSPLLRISVGV